MPTTEYRKKLRERHIVEWFCLIVAAAMIALSAIFLMDSERSSWMPETVAILGGILNCALAVRSILTKSWHMAVIFFILVCVCFGLLAFLNYT